MSAWLVGAALLCLATAGAAALYVLWYERRREQVVEPPQTRCRLPDGITFIANMPLAAFCQTWRGAMRDDAWIELTNQGNPVVVNPYQIIYAEQHEDQGSEP